MGKLLLESISEVKTQKVRSDGKVSLKYYTGYFRDVENPFTGRGQRNFTQNHSADGKSAFWKELCPESAVKMIGKEFAGDIIRGETLPYDTAIVLKGENAGVIFAKAGKILVTESAQQPALQEIDL